MRTPGRIATLLLPVLLAGCLFSHGKGQPEQPLGTEDDQPEDVGLHVANHHWSDMVIFAVHGSSRIRLGDLTTGSEADFVVPRSLMVGGQITIVAHPIAGARDFSTGPIMVAPGQQIDLRIENALAQSNWSVS